MDNPEILTRREINIISAVMQFTARDIEGESGIWFTPQEVRNLVAKFHYRGEDENKIQFKEVQYDDDER